MQEQENKGKNKFLLLSGVAIQMGATIFLGAYLGKWLDQKFPAEKKWFTLILTLVAVVISLYNIVKQLNEINKK